ncbi:hypothetical protein ACH4U6_36640 [Streptomyces netropsis]|uniref:hypothetical protein n=1 Tax=Streptomyces netropsis TaxID=55404 RepID=UPI0037BB436D
MPRDYLGELVLGSQALSVRPWRTAVLYSTGPEAENFVQALDHAHAAADQPKHSLARIEQARRRLAHIAATAGSTPPPARADPAAHFESAQVETS